MPDPVSLLLVRHGHPALAATFRRVSRFAAVGLTGFCIDAILTTAFIGLGLDPFTARAAAIAIAMVATYLLNRTITFRHGATSHAAGIAGEAARYGLVAVIAAVFNWLVYSAALLAAPGLPPLAAIVIACGAAMAVSYIGYSRFAFRRPK